MHSSPFAMEEIVDCPGCGAEMEVVVLATDELGQRMERPVTCACGRVFTEGDLPDPVDESDGWT